jgi:hypothetical protein
MTFESDLYDAGPIMKSLSFYFSSLTIFLLIPFFAGCAQQTSMTQNQYGPRAAATQAKPDMFTDYWFNTKVLSPFFALATNSNLGAQIVRQDEITKPRKLGPVNPMAAVGAVDRYQKGQVRALPDVEVSVGGGSGGGSGGGGGGN